MNDPSEKEQAETPGLTRLPTLLIAGALTRYLTMLSVLLQAPLAVVMLQDCTEQVG